MSKQNVSQMGSQKGYFVLGALILCSGGGALLAGCASTSLQKKAERDALAAQEPCTREWARQEAASNAVVVGLGFSTSTDEKQAADEAQNQAMRDILVQLQSTVESRTESKMTTSDAQFKTESVLSSRLEDVPAARVVRSYRDAARRSFCLAIHFDARAAYQPLAAQLAVTEKKLLDLLEGTEDILALGGSARWRRVLSDLPILKKRVVNERSLAAKADVYQLMAQIPGEASTAKFERLISQLETANDKIRAKLIFILPSDQAQVAVSLAEVEAALLKAGARVVRDDAKSVPEGIRVRVEVKPIGEMTKAQSRVGELLTRRYSVRFTAEDGKALAANSSVTAAGTTEENLAAQFTLNILEAIGNLVPGFILKSNE